MKFQSVVVPAIAFVLCLNLIPKAALADVVSDAINDESQRKMQTLEQIVKQFSETVEASSDKAAQDQGVMLQKDLAEKMAPVTEHSELEDAMQALPGALSLTDIVIKDVMDSRYRELNRIPVVSKDHMTGQVKPDEQYKVDYLVDSSWTTPVDVQAFDIFMRYFCDPQARGGKMKTIKFRMENVPYRDQKIKYTLGCGEVDGTNIPTRHRILGSESDGNIEGKQVIALPMRPADLFFNPVTFPTMPGTTTTDNIIDKSNVNKMADVYYGAFAQSLQFLLGSAPPAGNSLQTQAAISRQMLASYPFAIMFSERVGSMDQKAALALGEMLSGKLENGPDDPAIRMSLLKIQTRKTISIAEYMDIVMYQMMTSPGYYTYISKRATPSMLQREEVWLSALQTALNYQRNRWLEILAALEAVR